MPFNEIRPADNVQHEMYVKGCVDGKLARIANAALSQFLRVGLDQYARGFRAGYFDRATTAATVSRLVERRKVAARFSSQEVQSIQARTAG